MRGERLSYVTGADVAEEEGPASRSPRTEEGEVLGGPPAPDGEGQLPGNHGDALPIAKMGNNMRVQNNTDEEKRVLSEPLGRLGGSVRRKVGLGWHLAS